MNDTGVWVTPTYGGFMAGMSVMTTPKVSVDGYEVLGVWHRPLFFPVYPGPHEVRVSYPWIFGQRTGEGTLRVDLAPGQIAYVTYRPPFLAFLKGRMSLDQGLPPTAKTS